MGKAGKKAKHGAKMARKRSVKAARKTQYALLSGSSKRRKRQGLKTGAKGLKHAHAMVDCGNPGCQKCNPRVHMHGPAMDASLYLLPYVSDKTRKWVRDGMPMTAELLVMS